MTAQSSGMRMTQLHRCVRCRRYTLKEKACPVCGARVGSPRPPRFSLEDKYGEYRRRAKRRAVTNA